MLNGHKARNACISILISPLFLLLLVFTVGQVQAQYEVTKNQLFQHASGLHFNTPRVFVMGNELSYPVIELETEQTLKFMFDELGTKANDYYYQLVYCNSDWSLSDLFTDEYLEGFSENQLTDYNFSINTTIPYVNYQVEIPNNNVRLKISGNYLMQVFESQNRDSVLLTIPFVVYEPIVKVEAQVTRPLGIDLRDSGQEINLKVYHPGLPISDPFNEVKVVILQNNRPDRIITDLKPVFIRDNELDYQLPGQNLFMGGNEFRIFDFSDKNMFGLNVNDVRLMDSVYHIQLRLDEPRKTKKYFWEQDMNGKFLVNLTNSNDVDESADYAFIHFYVPMADPILDGSIYVIGSFCQWQYNPMNKLTYNFDQQYYETVLFLKQGYYNYFYSKVDTYTHEPDELPMEGSHFQTENDYLIYVYHRGFGQKYDRLVGYQVINSKYRN